MPSFLSILILQGPPPIWRISGQGPWLCSWRRSRPLQLLHQFGLQKVNWLYSDNYFNNQTHSQNILFNILKVSDMCSIFSVKWLQGNHNGILVKDGEIKELKSRISSGWQIVCPPWRSRRKSQMKGTLKKRQRAEETTKSPTQAKRPGSSPGPPIPTLTSQYFITFLRRLNLAT